METPPHVPSPVRWRFVIVSCVLWMTFAIAMIATLPEFYWWPWMSLWPWVMGALLLLLWAGEKWIRRVYLPRPGRAAWCFRVSLLVGAMAVSGMWLVTNFGEKIPGLYVRTQEGSISSYDLDAIDRYLPRNPDFDAQFIEQSRSVRGSTPGSIEYQIESLHIRPYGQSDATEWVIRHGEMQMRSEPGGDVVPWNGEGVVNIVERLSGPITSPRERQETTEFLDNSCKSWSTGMPFKGPHGGRGMIICGIFPRPEHPPKWLQISMIGFPVMLLMFAIPITARETMGHCR